MSEAVAVKGELRAARASNLSDVAALLRAADLPVDGVADQFEDGYAVMSTEDGLVGVAGLEVYGGYGLLRSVAVAEGWRGRGAGEALVRDRLAWARGKGLRSVYLLTTTAAPWFTRLGFHQVDRDEVPATIRRAPEFSGVCPSSAQAMAYDLVAIEEPCCDPSSSGKVGGSAAPCCGPASTTVQLERFDSGDADSLKATVRERYGAAAVRAAAGGKTSCCGASAGEVWDPITADLYDQAETTGLPTEAVLASLGCGNPTALATLAEGETVLDLGSGGGIDVLLSARRVGPTGRAYGLDMTDEMLELARANQARAGVTNVEFLKGDIESIPLPDASVDVIISNCVINLAADKGRVLREAFRVLKPGGRFAVSDVVARRAVPDVIRRSMELWMGCVAGALEEETYARLMEEAGFEDVALEPTRIYGGDDVAFFLDGAGIRGSARIEDFDGAFMSAFIRGVKPRD
ncbi:hypothetical protein BH23GEM9_BH23GEM9_06600 [soil metagenome]